MDIDIVTTNSVNLLDGHYHQSGAFILNVYRHHPRYEGKMELREILRWHFLQPLPKDWVSKPGETYLSRQREYTKMKVLSEVSETRNENPDMPMKEVFATIENYLNCFLQGTKNYLLIDQCLMKTQPESQHLTTAANTMNLIARIIYYYSFKNALIRNEEKKATIN